MAAKLQAIGEQIRLMIEGDRATVARLTAEAARRETARIKAEQASRAGIAPVATFVVDGLRNAPLEQVDVAGRILVEFDYLREIAAVALAALRQASPVDSGAYRDAHAIFVNRQEVPTPAAIPPDAEVTIANPVPYSRRIEVASRKLGRRWSLQAPAGVYEPVAAALRARYGNVARIEFNFVSLVAQGRAANKSDARIPGLTIRNRT